MSDLFQNSNTKSDSPGRYSESDYDCLCRSNRDYVVNTKRILNLWFEGYPIELKHTFQARIKDSNNIQHQSAFFELLVYQLLNNLNLSITLEEDSGNGKKPDFSIYLEDSKIGILECVLSTDRSTEDQEMQKYINPTLDYLNEKVSLDEVSNFLSIEVLKWNKNKEISKSNLKNAIIEKYKLSLPEFEFESNEWKLKLNFLGDRLSGDRLVGLNLGLNTAEFIDSKKPLLNTVEGKVGKYTIHGFYYILAINNLDPFLNIQEVMIFFDKNFWSRKGSPDAILFFDQLYSTSFLNKVINDDAEYCLLISPESIKSEIIRCNFSNFNTFINNQGILKGQSLCSLLGL